jgi:predicted DNA binding CopG/RHH family protein
LKKKQDPQAHQLDKYEQAIDDAVVYGKLRRPSASKQNKVRATAKATLQELKSARANIRMNENDLEAIRAMADGAGMPYQTLINHIIHLYVTGQLINTNEVKKMIDAGLFDRRKAGNG